jgi:transposase InsO family protein
VPWKESCQLNERMKFVARIEEGERISDVCVEFGISRKTGYKFLNRFRQYGPVGLYDEPKVAVRLPHRLSSELATLVLDARKAHPSWGPRKLRAWLLTKHPGVQLPAPSTIGELLKRQGLIQPRRRRRTVPLPTTARHQASAPNQVWCADFKGQFRLGNGRYCYPLTISDAFSRYIIGCEGLEDTKGGPARSAFEMAFREYGLPDAILTDNGAPFASRALLGLSQLSVWWLRLGIRHERIEPGHPEQNGRHERMHRTLKAETTRPVAAGLLQQQERFDRFVHEYNVERPHEALDLRPPSTAYASSPRRFPGSLPEPEYPLHDITALVASCGHVRMPGPRSSLNLYLSATLAGQRIGLREVDDDVFLLSFLSADLGLWDLRNKTFSPLPATGAAPGAKTVTDGPGL